MKQKYGHLLFFFLRTGTTICAMNRLCVCAKEWKFRIVILNFPTLYRKEIKKKQRNKNKSSHYILSSFTVDALLLLSVVFACVYCNDIVPHNSVECENEKKFKISLAWNKKPHYHINYWLWFMSHTRLFWRDKQHRQQQQ